jgi:hypothetical protein
MINTTVNLGWVMVGAEAQRRLQRIDPTDMNFK